MSPTCAGGIVHYSRRSPFFTNILRPIPTALRSLMLCFSIPQGHWLSPLQSGSTAPLFAQLHFLSLISLSSSDLSSEPQAAQTSYSSETSRSFTFERRTYFFRIDRRGGAAASVEARESYSMRYAGFPSGVLCT